MTTRCRNNDIIHTLEDAAAVRNTHWNKHVDKILKVQRAATRWVPSLRDLSCEGTLRKLQLPMCPHREKVRGDMIMMYKCVEGTGKIDVDDYVIPSQSALRGHSKKLYKTK